MRRRIMVGLLALLLGCTVAACTDTPHPSTDVGTDDGRSPVTSASPPVRPASTDDAALRLWVSNQSFADSVVAVTISIDGVEIVDQRFSVGNQHNWILFPIDARPGRHVVKAVSDTGAEMTKAFRLPENGQRHAVVDYWQDRGDLSPKFTWRIQSKPVVFM